MATGNHSGERRAGRPASAGSVLVPPEGEVEPVLSVVLPTMNEEEGVGECIDRATAALESMGVSGEIIVSDSSTDRTPEIARSKGAVVVEPDKPGYGYAYRYAFERARGEFVAIGDADTTYDFEELPKLVDRLIETDADMAIGSRFEGEIKPGAMPPLHQYVGNPLLTRVLNTVYDLDVSDAHSGFRVLTDEALANLELRTEGMEFASEMIMEAGAKDLDIVEVPITYHEREGEATLESFRDGWRHVEFMLVNAPGFLFGLPGALLAVLGVTLLALGGAGVTLAGLSFGPGSLVAGGLLTVAGYQVAALAAFSALAANPIKHPLDPVSRWARENFRFAPAAAVGLVLAGAGGAYLGWLVANWLTGGPELAVTTPTVLAFTALVVGLQTVFNAFFVGALVDE